MSAKISYNKNPKFFTIGKKLLIYIVLASSIVTTVLTAGVFYLEYKEEQAKLGDIENNLRNNLSVGLAHAVYNFNTDSVKNQVDGISNIPDIISIKILDEDNTEAYSIAKRDPKESDRSLAIKLETGKNYPNRFAGTMIASITSENMNNRLIKRAVVFFATQLVKTFTTSFLILFIIYAMLTKHIVKIASSLETKDFDNETKVQKIRLDRTSRRMDEIDILVDNLNMLERKVVKIT